MHLRNITKKHSKSCLPLLDYCHTASPESKEVRQIGTSEHKLENQTSVQNMLLPAFVKKKTQTPQNPKSITLGLNSKGCY